MLGPATGARPFGLIEEAGGRIDHSDSQTFALSLSYTNSLQFTNPCTPKSAGKRGAAARGESGGGATEIRRNFNKRKRVDPAGNSLPLPTFQS